MTEQVQQISLLTQRDLATAPCLGNGPIAHSARELVGAARRLGTDHRAAQMRALCVLNLVENMERIFASGEDPVNGLNVALDKLTKLLGEESNGNGVNPASAAKTEHAALKANGNGRSHSTSSDVEEITGRHYGRLFESFSTASYWDEPVRLLQTRLERNGVLISQLDKKRVLDAGCGGGRYSVAWRLLDAHEVIGVDASEIGIADGRRRVAEAKIDRVTFETANVLKLPFADNSFDVVFSNGVLHHTTDWQVGVRELVRVLKPSGTGWLYLIENPGGLFWDTIEILRLIMREVDRDEARNLLSLMGVPANRVFYLLDHVMVPINERLTPTEIEECLSESGALEIRRLTRGADFDRIERIYQNDPFAELKYGVGENRYVFSKA